VIWEGDLINMALTAKNFGGIGRAGNIFPPFKPSHYQFFSSIGLSALLKLSQSILWIRLFKNLVTLPGLRPAALAVPVEIGYDLKISEFFLKYPN